mgnify:FL=1|jgi:hypothetical protein
MKTKLNCYYILNTLLLISGIAFDFILFSHPFFISVAMKIIIATVLCIVVILDIFVCKQLLSEGSTKMPKTESIFVSVLTFVLLISQSIYLTIITLMGVNEILGTIKAIHYVVLISIILLVATRLHNKYITKKHTLAFGIDIIAIVMCLIICANCVLCLINGNDLFSYIAINEYNKLNS